MSERREPKKSRVTRVDGAHPVRGKEAQSREESNIGSARAAAGGSEPHAAEQLRNQAGQLARHLQLKQQQIDHREAQLNARVAQLERELRNSRLSSQEQVHSFQEREQALEQQVLELRQQLEAVASAEASAANQEQRESIALKKRQAELEQAERRLLEGQTRLATEAESMRVAVERLRVDRAAAERELNVGRQELAIARAQLAQKERDLLANVERHRASVAASVDNALAHKNRDDHAALNELREKEQTLATASCVLDEQTQALEEERHRFNDAQAAAAQTLAEQHTSLEQWKQRAEEEVAALREKLSRRQSRLDDTRKSLEQTKHDVHELHREAIEMRMVAEQLWQRLAKRGSVAELTTSLGKLRTKLADEFRLSHEELDRKQHELQSLAEKLDDKQYQVKRQRVELQEWLERRYEGIEEQAARLVARELELDQQQQAIQEREGAWDRERRQLQAQLREVTKRLLPVAA